MWQPWLMEITVVILQLQRCHDYLLMVGVDAVDEEAIEHILPFHQHRQQQQQQYQQLQLLQPMVQAVGLVFVLQVVMVQAGADVNQLPSHPCLSSTHSVLQPPYGLFRVLHRQLLLPPLLHVLPQLSHHLCRLLQLFPRPHRHQQHHTHPLSLLDQLLLVSSLGLLLVWL